MIMNHKITKDENIHPRKHLKEIKLYVYNPKDQLIWSGHSNLIFTDILVQISNKKLSGYYAINSLGERGKIHITGRIIPDIKSDKKIQNLLSIILGF